MAVLAFGMGLALALSSATLPQQPPQLKTSVNATSITIGDVLTLKLEVKHAESLKVAFPAVGATLGEWVVRGVNRLPARPLDGGLVEDVLAVQLTIYKTGDIEIPPLSIETVTPEGQTSGLNSEPVKISIQSVLTGSQDTLKDVKPQAEIAADYKPFLFFLAALGSAAYLIHKLIQRLRNRKRGPSPIPLDTRTPEEIAREAIRQLLARKLVEQGYFKQFYLELSEILKRFLGSKLRVPSLERTTGEFLGDLRAVAVPTDQYRLIREFLEDCDLVKFAKYRPASDEVQQIVTRSREIIDNVSTPAVPEPRLAEVAK
jgi:hypothetical protein